MNLFPELSESLSALQRAQDEWVIPGWKRLSAICFPPAKDAAFRAIGKKPRTNKLGESFSDARVLNTQNRIEQLKKIGEDAVAKVGEHMATKAETVAAAAEARARKLRQVAREEPLLVWLKSKGYLPAEAKIITKKGICDCYFRNKELIDRKIGTSTALALEDKLRLIPFLKMI